MLVRELDRYSFAAMPKPIQQMAIGIAASQFKGMSLEEAARLLILQIGNAVNVNGVNYFRFTFEVRGDLYCVDVPCADADDRMVKRKR